MKHLFSSFDIIIKYLMILIFFCPKKQKKNENNPFSLPFPFHPTISPNSGSHVPFATQIYFHFQPTTPRSESGARHGGRFDYLRAVHDLFRRRCPEGATRARGELRRQGMGDAVREGREDELRRRAGRGRGSGWITTIMKWRKGRVTGVRVWGRWWNEVRLRNEWADDDVNVRWSVWW